MSRIIAPYGQIPDNAGECLYPALYPTIGWWCPSLHPLGGLQIADLTNNNNVGTLNAELTDWTVDQGKGALNFVTDDWIEIHSAAKLTQTAVNNACIAYSAWVKTNSTSGLRVIVGGGSSASASPYCVLYQTGTTVGFTFRSNSNVVNNAQSTATIATGVWTHLVGVARNRTVEIWMNGVLRASVNFTIGATTINRHVIGAFSRVGQSDFFNGLIDDVRAYNTPIFPEHVRALYQLGRGNLPIKTKRKYIFVSAAGDQTITANLFTNTSTVYNPTVSAGAVNISANLLTNTSTFYNATVTTGTSNIDANLLTNTSTVYNPTVTAGAVNINANLFTNTNTFYDAVVSIGDTIITDLLTNTSTVYNPTVTAGAVNITAQLLTNTSTIYLPTVALLADNISALRINNTSVVYLPTITGGDAGVRDTSDIFSKIARHKKKRKYQDLIDEENIAAQLLKARQGKQQQYEKPTAKLELNLRAKLNAETPITAIVEEVAEAAPEVPFTDEMRQEISAILEKYQLKLKQQKRAKQLQALMLLATMDD
jgi:hypothetical protein